MHPEEKKAVRTTIVGGRPPGSGKDNGAVPQGIEVLVKKAAVDAEFRALLLEARADAARAIDLELSPSEAAMLEAAPTAQLEAIIARTRVHRKVMPALLGHSAAAMLVALSAVAVVADGCDRGVPATTGVQPDRPEPAVESVEPADSSAATQPDTRPADRPTPPPVPQGIRPDRPPPSATVAPDAEPPQVAPQPEPKPPPTPAPVTGIRPDPPPPDGSVKPATEPPQVAPKPAPKPVPPSITRGISPDRPPVTKGIRPDRPPATLGIQPDRPKSESR